MTFYLSLKKENLVWCFQMAQDSDKTPTTLNTGGLEDTLKHGTRQMRKPKSLSFALQDVR